MRRKILAIKEMPLEEKHEKLLDYFVLLFAALYVFNKEQGTLDKFRDFFPKIQSKMMPSLMGGVFKMMKTFSPGRTFKKVANQMAYMEQMIQPSTDMEVISLSDREFVMKFNNCRMLKKMQEVVKKAGLNVGPRELCEFERSMHTSPEHPMTKSFGIVMNCELEENGCKWIMKLK